MSKIPMLERFAAQSLVELDGELIFSKEKFAELIVRECMDIARNVGNITEPDDWALDRCYEIEQRIQDRFGVEE